jgi:hypothetical protein
MPAMWKVFLASCVALSMFVLIAGCPGKGIPGRGGSGLSPDSCGKIDTNPVGRKLYAFLKASAELDKASVQFEASVHAACRKMARELGIPDTGDTKDTCTRVANEIDANLKISIKSESKLVTRYKPPECHTEVDFAAGFAAKCEAKVAADVEIHCDGRCGGTCNGTCSTGGTGGQCAGKCEGRCSGRCEGNADVKASAECKASAEIHASLETTCTEPKIEIVRQNVTVIDDSKFQKAMKAIEVGLPAILRAAKKLEIAGKAVVQWTKTGASLVAASGDLVKQLGTNGICVGAQLAASVAAAANIQARFSVSIEVSAKVSTSCGATSS